MTRVIGPARGVLRAESGAGRFHHARLAPAAPLEPWLEHYWIVRWDLRGHPPQRRETLPHPNLHLVFGGDGARLHGIHRGRFRTTLEGEGAAIGVKFRPGGARPWLGASVTSLRGRSLPAADVFGPDVESLATRLANCNEDAAVVAALDAFLLARRPAPDPQAERAAALVDLIRDQRDVLGLPQLQARSGLGARALQRLFGDYVGIGPKWVIQRYRLHEALARADAGEAVDWAALAQELGYFDQAHLIRDFRTLVGRTPAAYAAGVAPTPTRATAGGAGATASRPGRGSR